MRPPHALTLAAFVAAAAAAMLWWLGRGPELPPDYVSEGPSRSAPPTGAPDDPPVASGRTAVEVGGALGELGAGLPALSESDPLWLSRVDVYFVWSDGSPVWPGDLVSSAPGTSQLRPCLLAPDATSADGADPLPRASSRSSSEPGWFTAIARPLGALDVGIALGGEVLARQRVQAGASAVRVTLDRNRVHGALCTIRGRVGGLGGAAALVAAWPPRRGLGVASPFRATGEGDGFVITGLPPGRVTLVLGGRPAQLRQGLFELARDRGLSALSQGRRVPDQEQWDLRLDYLRTCSQPIGRWRLELSPGEDRDLGELEFERAAAVVLRLLDTSGTPLDATGVQIARLEANAGDDVPEAAPTIWTFDSWAAISPLPPRETVLFVTQGERAARLTLTPDTALEPHAVTLDGLSVLQLPESADARVSTDDGHVLVTDPRWVGSTYRGVSVTAGTWLLPPGHYRIEGVGAPRSIALSAEHRVDLREGSRYDGPLAAREEDR